MGGKTTFCLHSGLNTIGGNIAEIRYGSDRVLFDFGRAYNPADTLLTNAQGRENSKVSDMLRLGMLPAVAGLYDNTWQGNTAVFISHLHLDHMGAIDVIHPDVPVYMSREGAALYQALIDIGEGPFRREIHVFDYEQPVHIGEIAVAGYAIDHDVHGAAAILVETPDNIRIAHSGDIRMRGQRPELNHRWIAAMREKNLDYLLMEGTAFWPPRENATDDADNKIIQHNEADVPQVIADILHSLSGVCFFNFYHRNIERMENLCKAAQLANRRVVFEPATARLAAQFLPEASFGVLGKGVSIADINQNPAAYFVQSTLANIFSLIDYDPAGSGYIHTNGIPLGSFDPAFNSMLSFLHTLGIGFHAVPSAGHGDRDDILAIVDGIKPKVLVPWHSPAPAEMIPLDSAQQVLLPVKGEWY